MRRFTEVTRESTRILGFRVVRGCFGSMALQAQVELMPAAEGLKSEGYQNLKPGPGILDKCDDSSFCALRASLSLRLLLGFRVRWVHWGFLQDPTAPVREVFLRKS